jgi:glutathione synthase
MRIAFIVNDRRGLGVEQTTTLLIGAAARRGHQTVVCGIGDFSVGANGGLTARGCTADTSEPAALTRAIEEGIPSVHALDEYDVCVVRTNPGRDAQHAPQHIATLRLLERLDRGGCRVINSPRGLSRALTKLSLLELPAELRPRTLVTRDVAEIEGFVQEEARAVIKPLEGTRGRDVFVLDGLGLNAKQIIDVVLRQGYAVVQEFVAGAERGDLRVTVIDGEVLEVDGKLAAVARVPGRADFRSNLHAGGAAAAATVTLDVKAAIAEIAPILRREGLRHVGVDFVGNRILELNVFSPGGLFPCERLYERDFAAAAIEAFERPL